MAYFRKNFKHNMKNKLMHYGEGLNSPNFLIKVVIKLDYKLYKYITKISDNNFNSKTRLYQQYIYY